MPPADSEAVNASSLQEHLLHLHRTWAGAKPIWSDQCVWASGASVWPAQPALSSATLQAAQPAKALHSLTKCSPTPTFSVGSSRSRSGLKASAGPSPSTPAGQERSMCSQCIADPHIRSAGTSAGVGHSVGHIGAQGGWCVRRQPHAACKCPLSRNSPRNVLATLSPSAFKSYLRNSKGWHTGC